MTSAIVTFPHDAMPGAEKRASFGDNRGKSRGDPVRLLLAFFPHPAIRRKTGWRKWRKAAFLAAWFTFTAASQAFCSNEAMKGPPMAKAASPAVNPPGTSLVRAAFLGAIEFYQKRISPMGTRRCGFYPSCSAFAHQAVREQGPLLGVIMTGDRLTRCNIFKGPGPDYFLLPDGRLFDPVSRNLLTER